MFELNVDNTAEYLRQRGLIAPGADADVRPLAWGVSNLVLRASPAGGPDLVVKQSRKKLRTQADWFSRLDRIWREADVIRAIEPHLPRGSVPRVLFEDRENYVLGLEALDADHEVWKAELLAGAFDSAIAAAMGEFLGTIHRATAGNPALAERLGDRVIFDELRIDPFYRRIAAVHDAIRPAIERLIEQMLARQSCLVLADFSPKNILIVHPRRERRCALVDFETGHVGDPAFDLGFFLSHLCLKMVRHAGRAAEMRHLIDVFWERYRAHVGRGDSRRWPAAEDEPRIAAHLAACLLARIDGKSTVDYLAPAQQEAVRNCALDLLQQPPETLAQALDRIEPPR